MPHPKSPFASDGRPLADQRERAACQSAIRVPGNQLPAVEFRRSLKVDWSKVIDRKVPRGTPAKRGRIGSMTPRSGQRLLFALNNAPRDWGAMATLTFRNRVIDGREAMRGFLATLRAQGWGDLHFAWVREYQGRGAVHYHFLFEKDALERFGWLAKEHWQQVGKGKRARTVLRGPLERIVVEAWLLATGDESREFEAFQWGGIVEPIREASGAARYFASYLGKEDQKTLPADAECCGRWWYVCDAAKPLVHSRGHLTGWNREIPLSTVFDKHDLEEHYTLVDLPVFIPDHWKPKAS